MTGLYFFVNKKCLVTKGGRSSKMGNIFRRETRLFFPSLIMFTQQIQQTGNVLRNYFGQVNPKKQLNIHKH